MSEKLKKVIEVSDLAHSDYVEVWTPTFKAVGSLFKEEGKTYEGLITLSNVKVYPLFHEEHKESCFTVERDWLNIFEDKIIAFTVL